jgi:2-succinyl-5-enolpyruvyl-6-hydroxy-3-cyclohexene-1-carboxylate synthase
LKIVLLNNQGGNIFRMIDGPARQPELEEFFETEQTLDASHLCQEMGFNYFPVKNEQDLEQNWSAFMSESSSPALIEIFTDKKDNAAFFKSLKNSLKQSFKLPETTHGKS